MKNRFTELLKYTTGGLLGLFLPAMVLVHFAPFIPGLIIFAILTTFVGGLLCANTLAQEKYAETIADYKDHIDGQRQLLVEKEALIEAQEASLTTARVRHAELLENAVRYQNETKQIKEDTLADKTNYNKQGWLVSKVEKGIELYFGVIAGLFVWTDVPTVAIRFQNKRSADAWLSHYENRFSFVRNAQTSRYPRKDS